MDNITLYLISISFLLVNLILGLWAGKGVKTFEDYAIAARSLSTGALVMTLMATCVGPGDLGFPAYILDIGPSTQVIGMAAFTFLLLFGAFIAPFIISLPGCLTTGDLMSHLYGNKVGF